MPSTKQSCLLLLSCYCITIAFQVSPEIGRKIIPIHTSPTTTNFIIALKWTFSYFASKSFKIQKSVQTLLHCSVMIADAYFFCQHHYSLLVIFCHKLGICASPKQHMFMISRQRKPNKI